jgi:hypothetical protein
MSVEQKRAAVADLYPGWGRLRALPVAERASKKDVACCSAKPTTARLANGKPCVRRRGGLSESEEKAMRKRQQGDGGKTMPDCQIHAIYQRQILDKARR